MNILVLETGWGHAQSSDVGVLLENTASHLNRYLRSPFAGTIVVVSAPPGDPVPRTHIRPSRSGPIVIQLTAQDTYWAQFAFQFSHEFCHILSGYERLENNPNNWFHEALCELASVFTLRRMAETWPASPPFQDWSDYAHSLADYAVERISRKEFQLPQGETIRSWLRAREGRLREDPYQRHLNAVVAYSLLPLFESDPTGWNAIRGLPASASRLHTYLHEWTSSVHPQDRDFAESILDAFTE